ncbi:MAG: lyase family protein [Pseudomonadaceae bacterium]|nr:lyase family protein [Pseudomonadaceae bacterium]
MNTQAFAAGEQANCDAAVSGCFDAFGDMHRANQASLLTLRSASLVTREQASAIACALNEIAAEAARPGASRSANYLDVEASLLARLGDSGSALHLGRSRQDLHETVRRLGVRRQAMEVLRSQLAAREAFLSAAERFGQAIVPAYTHGVQAQPTTYGHILLAFSDALARDARRLKSALDNANLSPLGAAALTTSAFPIDRQQLSSWLGFAAPIANSFDATLISAIDYKAELASSLTTSALFVGQFAELVHRQYQHPVPWLVLEANMTSVSSVMPQKANPRPLDRLRLSASETLAAGFRVSIVSHNQPPGMNDYRDAGAIHQTLDSAHEMYRRLASVVGAIRVDEERALAEVNAEYSTSTALAEWLYLNDGLALKRAYRVASALAKRARAGRNSWSELTDEQIRSIYAEQAGRELVRPVAELRGALDAGAMIRSRVGSGGPQPQSVERLLGTARNQLALDGDWLSAYEQRIDDSEAKRRRAFSKLTRGCP